MSGGAAGSLAVVMLIAAVLLASRNTLITFLLGLSHERAIVWHGFTSLLALLLGLYHACASSTFADLTGACVRRSLHAFPASKPCRPA